MPQRQLSHLNGRKLDHIERIPLVSIVTVLLCASRFRGNVFTQPLLRNGLFLFVCCIATAVLATVLNHLIDLLAGKLEFTLKNLGIDGG
jgi:hypothetical protein